MKNLIKLVLVIFILSAFTNIKQNNIYRIISEFNNSTSSNVMVAAHRGDWRNAPENSIKAIQNCIEMGVDIVEIDVKKPRTIN